MSIRENLDSNPRRGIAVAAGLLLIALVAIGWQLHRPGPPSSATRSFYSVDDGKSWFTDDADKIPPFQKDGKSAVRAYVYRSAGGTEFVGFLERFKPDAKKVIDAASQLSSGQAPKNLPALQQAYATGLEVKRPGDAKWVSSTSSDAAKISSVKGPDGSAATLVSP